MGYCRYSVCVLFDVFNFFVLIILIFYSPVNAKELFNLCHAQAHNVIERIFGVLKQRFRILLLPSHYQLDFQACIPVALCALQNFIKEIDHNEGAIPTDPSQAAYTPFFSDNDDSGGFISEDDEEENSEVKLRRKNIANEMWRSYLNYLADGGTEDSEESDADFPGLSK